MEAVRLETEITRKKVIREIKKSDTDESKQSKIKLNKVNKAFNEKIDRESNQAQPAEVALRDIGEWMQGMKYPQATMWGRDPLSGDYYSKWKKNKSPPGILKLGDLSQISKDLTTYNPFKPQVRIKETEGGTLAEYRSDGTIILSKKQFLSMKDYAATIKVLSEEDKVTLAHELFHGVQLSVLKFEKYKASTKFTWISEGLAEAVGYTWQQHEYGHNNVDNYDIYYDSPLFEGDYDRGHFFII